MVEAWKAADEIEADATPRALAHALADGSTVCVLGWPELIGEGLVRRGDVEARVVDVYDEGGGLVQRLFQADSDVVDIPVAGLGAAVATSDLLVLEASAVGPTGFVAVSGSRAAAAVAHEAGVEVWSVAGVGRVLPDRLWTGVAERLRTDEPWEATDEIVPVGLVDQFVRPRGLSTPELALSRPDCPVAAELLREL
jgi:hypothetical protein